MFKTLNRQKEILIKIGECSVDIRQTMLLNFLRDIHNMYTDMKYPLPINIVNDNNSIKNFIMCCTGLDLSGMSDKFVDSLFIVVFDSVYNIMINKFDVVHDSPVSVINKIEPYYYILINLEYSGKKYSNFIYNVQYIFLIKYALVNYPKYQREEQYYYFSAFEFQDIMIKFYSIFCGTINIPNIVTDEQQIKKFTEKVRTYSEISSFYKPDENASFDETFCYQLMQRLINIERYSYNLDELMNIYIDMITLKLPTCGFEMDY